VTSVAPTLAPELARAVAEQQDRLDLDLLRVSVASLQKLTANLNDQRLVLTLLPTT